MFSDRRDGEGAQTSTSTINAHDLLRSEASGFVTEAGSTAASRVEHARRSTVGTTLPRVIQGQRAFYRAEGFRQHKKSIAESVSSQIYQRPYNRKREKISIHAIFASDMSYLHQLCVKLKDEYFPRDLLVAMLSAAWWSKVKFDDEIDEYIAIKILSNFESEVFYALPPEMKREDQDGHVYSRRVDKSAVVAESHIGDSNLPPSKSSLSGDEKQPTAVIASRSVITPSKNMEMVGGGGAALAYSSKHEELLRWKTFEQLSALAGDDEVRAAALCGG